MVYFETHFAFFKVYVIGAMVQCCKIFPIYEFITLTCGGGYDFSVFGARKLEVFIEERMKMNQPVAIPVGYEDRIY